MRWYLTAAATKQFQGLTGLSFEQAEHDLADLCDEARLLHEAGKRSDRAAVYRVKAHLRDGKRHQLDLYVSEEPRPEGPSAQLVRIRAK